MLRLRRYRVFLLFAVVFIILVVRLRHSRDYVEHAISQGFDFAHPHKDNGDASTPKTTPPPVQETEKGSAQNELPESNLYAPTKSIAEAPLTAPANTNAEIALPSRPAIPKVVLPDRPYHPTKVTLADDEEEEEIHSVAPPGRQEPDKDIPAIPTTIHWAKLEEHFPIPTESLIALPTGTPKKIPKIQYDFKDETADAKITREKRQTKVKDEFKRAWTGYKTKAWTHDELSPVSGHFRDPFCGWAATLVDTLDTLWIMGLEEEFEEAVKAVEKIDFTTSPRSDIPLFETTIRYLGGLLAAYDISGAKYNSLLDKAVELGEILIGAFDTPNRMPIVYYHWKPTFASQPHRANIRTNLAELGSLSVEFTRLAQLTKEPKYYDAVARVTNALSEWQDRGTRLDGVFPENVDASGCNRTVPAQLPKPQDQEPLIVPSRHVDDPVGYQPLTPENVPEPKPRKGKIASGPGDLELQVSEGQPSKAKIIGWEDSPRGVSKRDLEGATTAEKTVTKVETPAEAANVVEKPVPAAEPTTDPITGLPLDIPEAQRNVGKFVGDWDCRDQGLTAADTYSQKFSMGGGQDSTYEYYPKQYLLLGGLEEKYHKMYMQTVAAIRKHMLYRPMIPDMRDILFSGSVSVFGTDEAETDLSAEVEHLTCFIGGMIGMGAKIFDIEGDLEIAERLTDGCVWAYESTKSGIMPEGGQVIACENAEHCFWNETLYYDRLDPMGAVRDQDVKDYFTQKAAREKLEAETAALDAAEAATTKTAPGPAESDLEFLDPKKGSASLKKDEPASLQKRQLDSAIKEIPKPITTAEEHLQDKVYSTEAELNSINNSGRQSEVGTPTVGETEAPPPPPDPFKPLTHLEYVAARLRQEALPAGFVAVRSKKYILRPEAIESVWYMYRITGDVSWQNKGWRMFESIINATSTEFGHSAIDDVTMEAPYHVDEMESFWLAETLKYFYLLYSTPDVVSLDEWVLNTEAHPFKRPT